MFEYVRVNESATLCHLLTFGGPTKICDKPGNPGFEGTENKSRVL